MKKDLRIMETKGQKENKAEIYKGIVLVAFLAIILFFIYYFHLRLGTHFFTHFLYIPIILASFWWRRKGLFLTYFTAASYIFIHYFLAQIPYDKNALFEDFGRVPMYFIVSLIVIRLSERMQEEIKQRVDKEEQYQAVIKTSRDGFCLLDEQGKFLDVNDAFCCLSGYEHDELLSMGIKDLKDKKIIPEDRRAIRKIIRDGYGRLQAILRSKDSRIVPVEVIVNSLKTKGKVHYFAFVFDITERKNMEEALVRSNNFNKMLLDSLPFMLDIVDEEGNLLYINHVLENIFGKEVLGKKCWEIYNDDKKQCSVCPLKHNLEIGKTKIIEAGMILGNKTFEVFHVGIIYNEKKAVLKVFIDITAQKKAQEVLARSKEWLQEAVNLKVAELKESEKKLNDAKRLSDIGTLSATIAHELRNPLGVIKNVAYLINKKNKDPAIEKHIIVIEKEIMESDQIIENLLTYSRISEPKYEKIFCLDIFSESFSGLRHKYADWDVRLETNTNCGSKDFIMADRIQMQMLYSNIIDNAYQALVDKRGTITIIEDYDNKENRFSVTFKDTGVGMDESDMDRVFTPFFSKKARGTGLGLALCKQIVELHSGTISIKSKKNEGTEVLINLPIYTQI